MVREPEVRDDGTRPPIGPHQHHVRALEVAVHDPRCVRRGERTDDLPRDAPHLVERQCTSCQHVAVQRLAGEQLHREEDNVLSIAAVVVAHVEDATHVRVRDLARELDLAQEQRLHRAVSLLVADGLQSDVLRQLRVRNLVHLAHATAREEAHDAIATRDHLSDGEARRRRLCVGEQLVGDRRRRREAG